MAIKVGGVDLAESTINSELRIGVLEKILDHVLNQLGSQGFIKLSQNEIEAFRRQVFEELAKKYPLAGLKFQK